jgi:polar amino acid transport system substrate-binding protein
MGNILWKLSCACVAFGLFTALPALGACSRDIHIAWDDWPPYIYRDNAKKLHGLDVDLIDAITREAHCKVIFSGPIPAKRQYFYLLDGSLDMQSAASATPERKSEVWFTRPYRREIISLFIRQGEKSQFSITRLSDIAARDWRMIVPFNGWFGKDYAALRPHLLQTNRLSEYMSTDQGMRMLEFHRGDILLGDLLAFAYSAEQNHGGIEALPIAANDEPVHLMLSKKTMTQADVAALNAAIVRLTERGELQKIVAKYGWKQINH